MDNNEAWQHRETVAAHYRQELADTQAELTRTKRALEITCATLRQYAEGRNWRAFNSARETTFHPDFFGAIDRFGPKHGWVFAKESLDSIKKEVGE